MSPAPATTRSRSAEPAKGPAAVLAIGTSNPPTAFLQSEYPDFYFNITRSNHMTDLKRKFQRICDKSGIRKRYLFADEKILAANPNMCEYWANSLDARQDIMVEEVPKMGGKAAEMALKEWGLPKWKITHVIFCTTSGMNLPGADWALVKMLGLRRDVRRVMLYSQGCFAGGTVLRVAKDLAENNAGARVLVVCSEMTVTTFRGPTEKHMDSMVGQALFGDGAAALVIGADAGTDADAAETPIFEIHNAVSSILPDSENAIMGHLREVGLTFHLLKDVPSIISNHISDVVSDALRVLPSPPSPSDLNRLFWIAHPGGPAILDELQKKLGLRPDKLSATRHVLSEFGNMSSACVHFIMDHMRRQSAALGLPTFGEGCEWGLLLGFGPGLTVEAVLLRSVSRAPSSSVDASHAVTHIN